MIFFARLNRKSALHQTLMSRKIVAREIDGIKFRLSESGYYEARAALTVDQLAAAKANPEIRIEAIGSVPGADPVKEQADG